VGREDVGSGPALRRIPSVNVILDRPEVLELASRFSREFITDLVREAIDDLRRAVVAGESDSASVDAFEASLPARLDALLARRFSRRTSPVINATGVIVHTNLGRSPLSAEAIARASAAASGYCDLEFDVEEGAGGSRQAHLEGLLARLFPGARGLAVNNNAGAVMLALNTLADGREVLISRGELVEIGGSFRIPDVMAKSGAILREVGTTNRTRLGDFRAALGDRAGALLKVHTSNYRIVGFTEEAPVGEMAALAKSSGLPLMVDQGSGNLLDLSPFGLGDEPTVRSVLEQGADIVTFSGDKLLGGPQAGLVVGRGDLVAAMKSNPFYRALRPDKVTVAALEATLESFVAGRPLEEIPTLRMLATPAAEVGRRAEALAARLALSAGTRLETRVEDGASKVGGGAAPACEVPTRILAVRPRFSSAESYEIALRHGRPPVVARVRDGWLLVDLRTVPPDGETDLLSALLQAAP